MEAAKGFQLIPNGLTYELSPFEKVAILKRNSWLQNMETAQLETLGQHLSLVHIEKGHAIFRQGDTTPFMAIVNSGKVEISKEGHDGEAQVIAVIGQGHVIGEMSLIDGGARSATAFAAETTQVFVLTEDNFAEIRKSHTALWGGLLMRSIKTITQRLRRASGQFVDLLAENGLSSEREEPHSSTHQQIKENETEAQFLMRQMSNLNAQVEKLSSHVKERAAHFQEQPKQEIQIDPGVYGQLERHAIYHKQSMSQHINQVLKQHLQKFSSQE